jgi:hypothetical protein
MRDYTIQTYAMGSLFIEMDGIVVTRRICIAVELLLRNGRLDQWEKRFAGSCVQNTQRLAPAFLNVFKYVHIFDCGENIRTPLPCMNSNASAPSGPTSILKADATGQVLGKPCHSISL